MTMDERDASTSTSSEEELIRSETRLRAILAGMLDPVVTIDPYGKIRYANESCERTFGYGPSELIGMNVKSLMPEPYRSEHDAHLAKYRETGETHILGQTREFPVVRKDGEQIEVELSVSRIDIPGQDPLFCGSFRDVTTRKETERALAESESRFRAIFDQEFQFVGLLDPRGILLEANQASLDAAGAKREDVIGRPFTQTCWWSHSERERELLEDGIRRAAEGEFVRFETSHSTASGRVVNIDFSLKPFRDENGEIVLLLPEGRDITDIKRAQQREVAMMRAFAEIGESASILAHEIKNPITAVNLALRAVADHLGESDQAVLEDLVHRMEKLEALMRRTLSLARPLELHKAPCRISEVLENAARTLRPRLTNEGVELELVAAPGIEPLDADSELLEEVLINLVGNALDALEQGGRIRLETVRAGDRVLVRIDDDGPGIPESVLATLFKPFVSTKKNGTGLGLAIARKIVEGHDGTLHCSTSPLGGARFEIDLPGPG